jgi:hypothetical protein
MTKPLKHYMDEAAKARSDLNIFYGVISILEGGTISADSNAAAQRIIDLCKNASAKCLRRMDDAIEDAGRRYGQEG